MLRLVGFDADMAREQETCSSGGYYGHRGVL